MPVKIDRRLNLVVPIDRDEGKIFIHSMPLSREAFEANFLLMSKVFAAIYAEGLNVIAGPPIASLMLRKIANDMNSPESAIALLSEVRRLSNVFLPGPSGWSSIPLQDALDRQELTREEAAEAEGAIVFFTLASALHKRSEVPSILAGLAKLWAVQITSQTTTEFKTSLPTSTPAENSGETAAALFIPH